jgi:hypothetical protein
MQSAVRWTVGFSNIYCEMQQIYRFCVTSSSCKMWAHKSPKSRSIMGDVQILNSFKSIYRLRPSTNLPKTFRGCYERVCRFGLREGKRGKYLHHRDNRVHRPQSRCTQKQVHKCQCKTTLCMWTLILNPPHLSSSCLFPQTRKPRPVGGWKAVRPAGCSLRAQ